MNRFKVYQVQPIRVWASPYAYGLPVHVCIDCPYRYTRTGLAHTHTIVGQNTRMGQNMTTWSVFQNRVTYTS